MTCHKTPFSTAPLNATTAYTPGGPNVPYDVRMVNDGNEEFAAGYPGNHATPDAPGNYAGCAARGVSNANCVITCTACHDSHGSSNAMILRDTIVPPDWQAYTITNATWAGGTVTLSYRDAAGRICSPGNTGGCSVSVGVPITVAGITPTGYNGSFTTTQSGLAPIQYALTPDPGAYVNGGTVAPPRSYTLTGWNGNMDTLPRQWCLTCHISRGSDHKSGSTCTSCHRHNSGRAL